MSTGRKQLRRPVLALAQGGCKACHEANEPRFPGEKFRMTVSRRRFLAATGGALAAPALIGLPTARAQSTITLKLHHFLPAISNAHVHLFVPWAKKVEETSQGRLKIDIFPSMQLGGTPPQLYDQARDGVVDIIWTLPGNTPGRFPTTEALELPFVLAEKAMVNARAAQEYADLHLKDEVKDVKLLAHWLHDAGHIHANRPVRTMEDLKGLKLRSPTRLTGEALKALGATAVGMPIPQVPESLAQKVIDGCVVPWEVVPSIRVHELLHNHTEIVGSPTLYATTFFLAMNKAKYEGLPADLRAALDKCSGMVFAEMAGNMWDTQAVNVRAMVAKRGNTIIPLAADEKARWVKTTEPVHAAWIEQVKAKGLDGAKLIESGRALVAKYEKA
jgi:TRAP-type C4-dicarboxylate transport system substrate-binding protein